jgi:hypothetical protein
VVTEPEIAQIRSVQGLHFKKVFQINILGRKFVQWQIHKKKIEDLHTKKSTLQNDQIARQIDNLVP